MSLRTLLRELGRHPRVSEYVVNESQSRLVTRGVGRDARRAHELRHHFEVEIFVDGKGGRGRTMLSAMPAAGSDIRAQIDEATVRAAKNLGPMWRLPSPTAPARVRVADKALLESPAQALEHLGQSLARHGKWVHEYESTVVVDRIRCVTSSGVDNSYRATRIGARVVVGATRRSQLEVEARRSSELGLERRIEELKDLPSASPVPPGSYDLVVEGAGFGTGPRHSIFLALVELANARRYRQGIGRVRLGARVSPEGFSLHSDGARDFGLFARPFDAQGYGTRRFAIVEGGLFVGLALTATEAVPLGQEPNGGMGNLVVQCETASDEVVRAPVKRDVLVVEGVSWVRSDSLAAGLQLAVARGRVISLDGTVTHVAGGVVSALGYRLFTNPIGTERQRMLPWLQAPEALRLGRIRAT